MPINPKPTPKTTLPTLPKTTLFIHPRKGLYRITSCSGCGHLMECKNCTAPLVAYRQSFGTLELICHQCQSFYQFPIACPSCHQNKLNSKAPGIDQLAEFLGQYLNGLSNDFLHSQTQQNTEQNAGNGVGEVNPHNNSEFSLQEVQQVVRLDKDKTGTTQIIAGNYYLTTRLFDPSLNYSAFQKIVFVEAQNLMADIDYTTSEETAKALTEVFLKLDPDCEVFFDTKTPNTQLFKDLQELASPSSRLDPFSWYLGFVQKELTKRERFKFPPFYTLMLLTSQEKNQQKALDVVQNAKTRLAVELSKIEGVEISSPYPAKFLKRKGLYANHLLIKMPAKQKTEGYVKKVVQNTSQDFRLQLRLNPRHLF